MSGAMSGLCGNFCYGYSDGAVTTQAIRVTEGIVVCAAFFAMATSRGVCVRVRGQSRRGSGLCGRRQGGVMSAS